MMTEAGEDGTCTLPVFVRERVVRGFGRGSKSLGVPTGAKEVGNV